MAEVYESRNRAGNKVMESFDVKASKIAGGEGSRQNRDGEARDMIGEIR